MKPAKPILFYYVHSHGAGPRACFNLLYPALTRVFDVIAITTNEEITLHLRKYDGLVVHQLPFKWPADMPPLEHTFSKAFEATPYAVEPAHRAAALAELIERYRPVALYGDSLPELSIMVRGMGVPVVVIHLPGKVMVDPTQVFTLELADHIIAHFPERLEQPDYQYGSRTFYSGFMSRYAGQSYETPADSNAVTILMGYDNYDESVLQTITADTDRTFTVIGNRRTFDLGPHCQQLGRIPDIAPYIAGDIVITAAGQNTVAELVSLQKKLILLPEPRPYDEQRMTTQIMAEQGLAIQADITFNQNQWKETISQAAALNPDFSGLVDARAPEITTQKLEEWYA